LRVCLYGKLETSDQSRLELYQTNLLLHAAEWQPEKKAHSPTRNTLIGEALRSRDTAVSRSTKSAQRTLEKAKDQLEELRSNQIPAAPKPHPEIAPVTDTSRRDSSNCCSSRNRLQRLTAELDLRLGLYKCSKDRAMQL